MMLRTPPPTKRPRPPSPSPSSPSHSQLVLPHSPSPHLLLLEPPLDCADPHGDDDLRCSYHCKQMVKSELLENLDRQEKQIAELSSQVESLQRTAKLADAEKKALSERVARFQQGEAAAIAREKAVEEKCILEMDRTEDVLRSQLKRCEELEVKLQHEMRLRSQVETKLDAATHEIALLESALKTTKEESKRQITRLEEDLNRMQKNSQREASKFSIENSAEKSRTWVAEAEVEALKSQCERLQKQLQECWDENRELTKKIATSCSQVSSSKDQDVELVTKNLRDELKRYEADVAEARKMKQFHANVVLLKEKLESERLRAERAENALGQLADKEVELESLKKELQSWKRLVNEIPGAEQQDDILRKFADLQRESLSATMKIAELTAQLEVARSKHDTTRVKGEENVNLSKDAYCDLELQNQRLKRKVELLTKERDGLKSILASYDEEENIITSQNKIETPGKAKEIRIQELESLVRDLQQEGEVLRSDIAKAEMKLGRGDYDPFSTRVVHMVENLDVNAEKQAFLAEIQSLREKIKSLEDNNFNAGIESTRNAELSLLREQVNSLEKREARYKKVFAEKISLFRQACCLLFGYMVEMSEEQQASTGMTVTIFTLQSIYAQNEEETMEFQLESNRMNLRANKYTSSPEISRMVEVYCKKFKSIPAFTANLTSELFNKSTNN